MLIPLTLVNSHDHNEWVMGPFDANTHQSTDDDHDESSWRNATLPSGAPMASFKIRYIRTIKITLEGSSNSLSSVLPSHLHNL